MAQPPSRQEARSRLGSQTANELGAPVASSIPEQLPGHEPRISKEGIRRCSRFAESTCRKYGHFEGVVTNADILEAIVGELRTDEGPVEPDAVQRDDGSWLIAGSMPVDEMGDRLSMTLLPERNYHTAAGFALNQLGHLPAIGEGFDHQGWRFEVVDLDGGRIDKILVRRIGAERRRAAV
jgi:putative hemolysin